MKTQLIEQTIRLAPEAVYIDEFSLEGGGVTGITMPGVGRLHVKLGELSEEGRAFVWKQICQQCSRPSKPAA